MKTSDISVNFGTPANGWMSVCVETGEQKIELEASDVPCNSIRALASALSQLLQGSDQETVEWSLEPLFAHWLFKRQGSQLELSIVVSDSQVQPFHCSCDTRVLIHRMIKALCDLGALPIWNATERKAWSWEFPKEKLAELKRLFSSSASS